MFRESHLDGFTSSAAAAKGTLRHADGSINFDAYREKARRARRAAIAASIRGAISLLSSLMSGVFAGKPMPAAKHRPT